MSRVAKMPITVPAGAEVAITAQSITVKGPLGTLVQPLNGLVKVENNNGTLSFDIVDDSREFLRLPAAAIQPPQETLTGLSSRYVGGIATLKDRLILVLQLDQLLNFAEPFVAA